METNKYIIELEDAPFIRHNVNGHCEKILYRVKGFNSLVFDWNGLQMLTPYTEPDTDACIDYLHKQGWLQDHDKQITESEYKRGYKDGTEAVVIPEDKVHEAYQRGYSAGKVNAYDEDAKKITKWIKKSEEAYQNGIDDLYKAIRKICLDTEDGALSLDTLITIFGKASVYAMIRDYQPMEIISKLREYEQEQEELKVGDEVKSGDERYIVLQNV